MGYEQCPRYQYFLAQQRAQEAQAANFGTGEIGGNRNFTAPVHGATSDNQPVTVSFGRGKH
jgi:hypothetical protein